MTDVRLEISSFDGKTTFSLEEFKAYSINHRLEGASNFSVQLPVTIANRNIVAAVKGWIFRLYNDDSLQMTGIIDEKTEDSGTGGVDLHISGRNNIGLLLDCVVPINLLSLYNLTLAQIATMWTVDLWPALFPGLVTNNAANRYMVAGKAKNSYKTVMVDKYETDFDGNEVKTKVPQKREITRSPFGKNSPVYAGIGGDKITQSKIKLGETIYNALQDLSHQIGGRMHCACDGTLVIDRPLYGFDPDAYGGGIEVYWDGDEAVGGNIKGVRYETSIAGRRSQYWVLGIGKSKRKSRAAQLLLDGGRIFDPSPAFFEPLSEPPWIGSQRLYKPGVIQVQNTQNTKRLVRASRRQMIEAAIAGFSLEYRLDGHRSASGALWTPDTTVRVRDERNALYDVYYIQEVNRSYSASDGEETSLKLIPRHLLLDETADNPSIDSVSFYAYVAPKITW